MKSLAYCVVLAAMLALVAGMVSEQRPRDEVSSLEHSNRAERSVEAAKDPEVSALSPAEEGGSKDAVATPRKGRAVYRNKIARKNRHEGHITIMRDKNCRCGKAYTGRRIVGGVETEVNMYPWQAAVVEAVSLDQFCGGSMITDRHILSAAHCFEDTDPADIRVKLREHDLDVVDPDEIVAEVAKITNHPSYNPVTNEHDIAIIELAEPIEPLEDGTPWPVCLPHSDKRLYGGKPGKVTGWGRLYSGGPTPGVLHEVDVNILSHRDCKNTGYSPGEIKKQTMMCAIGPGKDSCQGDSGGPLMFQDKRGDYDQVGVVSWGFLCAVAGYPGVYARVNKEYDFIIENTYENGIYCKGFTFPLERE